MIQAARPARPYLLALNYASPHPWRRRLHSFIPIRYPILSKPLSKPDPYSLTRARTVTRLNTRGSYQPKHMPQLRNSPTPCTQCPLLIHQQGKLYLTARVSPQCCPKVRIDITGGATVHTVLATSCKVDNSSRTHTKYYASLPRIQLYYLNC